MVEAGLSGEISDEDCERYCKGNPIYCYYFRKAEEKKNFVGELLKKINHR